MRVFSLTAIVSLLPGLWSRPLAELGTSRGLQSVATFAIARQGGRAIDSQPVYDHPNMVRALRATFYYDCPVGGRQVRAFEWQAVWAPRERVIAVIAGINVDTIGRIDTTPDTFSTDWKGHHCIQTPGRICSYAYSAQTQGFVDQHGIGMSMTTDSLDANDLPKITEWCAETTGVRGGYCPAGPDGPGPRLCRIIDIAVAVVQPHT